MLTLQELKSALGDNVQSFRPLWACAHDDDQDAAKKLIWELLDDAESSEMVRLACTISLGYMGDSRIAARLRLGYSSPMTIANFGYVVALANLNELDALLLLRDELSNPSDEFSTQRILGATRNCTQFGDCENCAELVSRINRLIFAQVRT